MSTIKKNTTDLQSLLAKVNELPTAGGSDPVLQDKTVTPTTSAQTITADSGYDGLDTVTVNAMPTATQATPSITINSSGLITATATQAAGYVTAGTKSGTKQLTTQAAKTVTPSASSQTAVASGVYTTGAVTVAGDANLKAENIAEGVSIFGVNGTHSGGGSGGGSVKTCTVTINLENISMSQVYEIVYVQSNNGDVEVQFIYEPEPITTLTNVISEGMICFVTAGYVGFSGGDLLACYGDTSNCTTVIYRQDLDTQSDIVLNGLDVV